MKKICIFSQGSDNSSGKVIEWLWYLYKIKVTRLNSNEIVEEININLDSKGVCVEELRYNNEIIDLVNFDYFWYRRGNFVLALPFYIDKIKNKKFESIINREHEEVRNFIFQSTEENTLLGSFSEELRNRKLSDLKAAAACGLNIPVTLITNQRSTLLEFLKKYPLAITKPISNHFNVDLEDHLYHGTGTRMINLKDVDSMAETFVPVMIQEYQEKEVEIRVFFSKDIFFSMAIFSQLDDQTSTDYRNYNEEKPNRNVPFCLPENIKLNLIAFIKRVGLDTGSIDLILTQSDKYCFLEINPSGIFDWLSVRCNYFIEEKIAHQIAHYANT